MGNSLTIMLILIAALSQNAMSADFPINRAFQIGDTGKDQFSGVVIGKDGAIVFGGTFIGKSFSSSPISLLDGTSGRVMRFNSAGTQILSETRIGASVNDLSIGADGRIAVCGDFGYAVLTENGQSALWSDTNGTGNRIDFGEDGSVAVLFGKTLRVYNAAGVKLGEKIIDGTGVHDICVDATRKQVMVTGFVQRATGRSCGSYGNCPVQVAFIRTYDYQLTTLRWTAYDWPGAWLDDGDSTHRYGNLMADTRGYVITMGADGMLYYAGESAGGNFIYSRDPQDLSKTISMPGYDKYSQAYIHRMAHLSKAWWFWRATRQPANPRLLDLALSLPPPTAGFLSADIPSAASRNATHLKSAHLELERILLWPTTLAKSFSASSTRNGQNVITGARSPQH
jgi:hypothetical protein